MRIFFTTVAASMGSLLAATSSPSGAAAPFAFTPQPAGDTVVVRAGTIHPGGGSAAIEDGAVAIVDGKIVAIGQAGTVALPAGAKVIDYGESAVIIPGLVAADSGYTPTNAGPRTADPSVLAIDKFDPYSNLVSALKSGITTVYLAPARGRLIAGQGAVVKSGGGDLGSPDGRVLLESAGLHGSISREARSTPGYWEPPVPATVDVGLGMERPQLPRTTMGAVLAIDELFALVGGDESLEVEYGKLTGIALGKAVKDGLVWRMGAETPGEVRALLDVSKQYGFSLVVDGASRAASMAGDLAKAGVPVIARPHYRGASNFGKTATADWPSYDTIARLVGEGVKVAIATPNGLGTSDLRFAAGLAMRGGLSADLALQAITQNAADILGVGDRVGSLTIGKDADMVVMTGAPMSMGSSVMATIVNGNVAWTPEMALDAADANAMKGVRRPGAKRKSKAATPVVISVDELHVGNGVIHSPGEILLRDGKIAEVAPRVARPAGAIVIRGAAAMPGMIDAYGHLGTEGGNRAFSTRFDTKRILEPGDYADREVAKRGVTTVNLISRNLGGLTPSIAYKPAATTFDDLVIDNVASVRLQWDSNITALSGSNVKQTLKRARDYAKAWDKYEADMAKWTPPAAEAAAEDAKDEEEDDKDKESDDKKDDKKKKKKKKERDPAKAVTGVFEGTLSVEGQDEPTTARFRFDESEDGNVTGSVRFSSFEDLLEVEGTRDDYDVDLVVETPDGVWNIHLAELYSNDPVDKKKAKKTSKSKDDEKKDESAPKKADEKKEESAPKKADEKKDEKKDEEDDVVKTFLRGDVKSGDDVVGSLDLTQTSGEYKVVRRPDVVPEEDKKKVRAPKGTPKKPSLDPDLEPLRRAMAGGAAVIVSVNRRDQVLECVETFASYGIKPILFDPAEAHMVADQLAGRVAGVLYPKNKMIVTAGNVTRNKLVEMSSAGVPVAFLSQAEEGASELSVVAAMAVARGLSPTSALKGLTSDAATMLSIDDRVGTLEAGKDADVVVLDGSPLEISSSVTRVFVNGREVE